MRDLRVLIVVDNFRIGGIQRLALDQLCMLSDLGIASEALYRQFRATAENPNFLNLESKRISEKSLKIESMPNSRFLQLIQMIRLFRSQKFSAVINLSVGATIILRFAKLFAFSSTPIHTIVEQLPSLSAPLQRWKRFVYAAFSNHLYCYSRAVVQDWNDRIGKNLISRFTLGLRRPSLLRNGVYLGRLPEVTQNENTKVKRGRIVFIGRNVAWKNPELVVSLLRAKKNQELTALIVVPSIDQNYIDELMAEFGSRIQFEIGKRIEDVEFKDGDINIYPVNYGPQAQFIESISINCLEMACLGIPSLITQGGSETWPELVEIGLLYEVDWNNPESLDSALERAKSLVPDKILVNKAQKLISIENNLESLIKYKD
jgi:hypothetical protein